MGNIYYGQLARETESNSRTKCRHLADHNFAHDKSNWNRLESKSNLLCKTRQEQELVWDEEGDVEVDRKPVSGQKAAKAAACAVE